MLEFLKDFWQFIKARKLWWFLPVLAALIIVLVFVALGAMGGGAGYYIYTLF